MSNALITTRYTMRLKTSIALAAALAASTAALNAAEYALTANPYASKVPAALRERQKEAVGVQARMLPSQAARSNGAEHRWKPGTAIYSTFSGISWRDIGKYSFTYDSEGRTIAELQESLEKENTTIVPFALIKTTYDDLGRPVSVEITVGDTPDNLGPYQRQRITYDPVLKYTVAEQLSESYLGGEWVTDDQSYKQVITRNENGDIVDMTASTWYDEEYLEVEKIHTTYDGRTPKTIQARSLGQNAETGDFEWSADEVYSDCEWFETDGQIISLNEITTGNNKIKSATVNGLDKLITDVKMQVTYDGEDYTSTLEYKYAGMFPTTQTSEYTYLPYGGHKQKIVMLQDLRPYYEETTEMIQNVTQTYDEYYNLTEAKVDKFFGHASIESWVAGDVAYDPTNGYPTEYLRREFTPIQDSTEGDWGDVYKIVYSDYVDLAGIEDIASDETDAAPEYYTIDGRKADKDNLGRGIYIRVCGGKAEKVLVK